MLRLVEVSPLFKQQIMDFRESFPEEEVIHGGAKLRHAESFEEWFQVVENAKDETTLPEGWVPASTYIYLNDDEMVGIINLRHRLNPNLVRTGGHIGYSIKPKFRGQGFGKKMLAEVLDIARQMDMKMVLITAAEDNPASTKMIEANGGVLENTVEDDDGVIYGAIGLNCKC